MVGGTTTDIVAYTTGGTFIQIWIGADDKLPYTMGAIYTVLPPGCATPNVRGQTYYRCGNTWFSPAYGANGVHYRVVPAP